MNYSKFSLLIKRHVSFAVLFLVCLTACSSDVLNKLNEFCEVSDSQPISKVSSEEGYFYITDKCPECWQLLIDSKFQYIEYCNNAIKVSEKSTNNDCWKVSKVDLSESSECDEDISKRLKNTNIELWRDFIDSHCVSVKKINNISSSYSLEISEERVFETSDKKSRIYRRDYIIKSVKTGKVGALKSQYIAFIHNPLAGGAQDYYCDSDDPKLRNSSRIIEPYL